MSIRNGIVLSLAAAAVGFASQVHAAQVGTVFVIAMENHNWTQPNPSSAPLQILGNTAAPFINSLVTPGNPNAAQVSYSSNYLNAGIGDHPSEPNYIWAEAGTNYNKDTSFTVNNDSDPTVANNNIFSTTPHLTGQMNAAGVTWSNYQEDYQIANSTTPTGGSPLVSKSGTSTTVTNPYYGTNQYNYAAKHNPMAFFSDTGTQNVKTFDSLRSDIAADTVSVSNPTATSNFGQYNWITPNQYNDMHSSLSTNFTYNGTTYSAGTDQEAVAMGDNFLATIIPQIMATQAYKNNGAIVIWNDETEKSGSSSADDAGHTSMEIVISPLAKGNAYASSVELNHSSDIKTMEEIFGLSFINNTLPASEPYGGTAGLNSVPSANDFSDLFQANAITTAVPEPASVGLLAIGGLTLLSRRRKNA
ncbi:MAG TPA: PEP-CTERM sorting domain-containing protein [Phycisphaerae bacterium]|nr:PEP-CTERM sorting domain-containing protein [Phycisphaerae bacterium]